MFTKANYATRAKEEAQLKRSREQAERWANSNSIPSDDGSFALGYVTGMPVGRNGLLGAVAGGHWATHEFNNDSSSGSSSDNSSSSDSSSGGSND